MTDRYHSLTVALEADIRDDDCEPLIAAIRQLRGVRAVTGHVVDAESYMAEERARSELGRALFAVIYPERKAGGR